MMDYRLQYVVKFLQVWLNILNSFPNFWKRNYRVILFIETMDHAS